MTTTNREEQLTMDEIPVGPFDPVPASSAPCEPTDSDVLCGRGGTINTHPGNALYRNLVEQRKRVYLTARFKREKRLISESIVKEVRSQDPPGRFLNRDAKDGNWYDIGDIKAREKTSQALRENLPKLRKELEAEKEAEKEKEAAAAAAAAKKKEEEEKERAAEQERLRREQQQWAGGYSYGHPPHYSHPHPPPPPHQNYHYPNAPPSRSFSSGGSGSGSASGSGSGFGSMGSSSYHHVPPHPPPPHHHHHHPRSAVAAGSPAPAPAPPSGAYPFGLPPRNDTKTESSVFNAVTTAFGLGPASSHPSAPPQAAVARHPGAPLNHQHQHNQDMPITAAEADEVAQLMLQDSPTNPGDSTAVAEPIPATSSNLTAMDDKSVASGMFSMAQHILFSWDNKSTATGKTSDKPKDDVPTEGTFDAKKPAAPTSSTAVKNEASGGIAPAAVPPAFRQQPFGSYRYEDEVSEEGQEVELLEMSSMDTEDMPPPPTQSQAASRRRLATARRSRGHQQIATRDHEARDPSTPPSPGAAARRHLPSNVFQDNEPHTPGGTHSLDDGNLTLEGMSLCSGSDGTTLGGQSLVGVFDDHQSNENASSGESAAMSTGTRASSGNKGSQQSPQAPHSGGAGSGSLKTNQPTMMGPPLSPMAPPPRSRHGSETYSVGDHSQMSVRSESKASVASSFHRLGSLALSPSTESALNACAASTGGAASIGGISFPDEDMMDGPTIKLG